MTRTFQDDELQIWEVYAAAPRSGAGHGGRMVFHCLTAPDRRARALDRGGDRTGVAKEVSSASDEELGTLLDAARPLD